MSGRRIDLSATHVMASVLAAMTGAVAASYLGVAGTLIGAAVVSFASTAGTAIYRHYLGRGQERLRTVAGARVPGAPTRQHHAAGASTGATQTSPPLAPGASARTARMPPLAPASARTAQLPPLAPASARAAQLPTVPLGKARHTGTAAPPDAVETEVLAVPRDAPQRPGSRGRPRRLKPVLLTLLVFLVTMTVITGIEAATGQPLGSLIWQRHGSGTTVGNVIAGHPGRSHPSPPEPTNAPAGGNSPAPAAKRPPATRPPTPTPTTSTAPSPSPTAATTAPLPSSSPSPAASSSPTVAPTPSGTPTPALSPSP